MSSTNKTTNYKLSQFIGSDKPAWLTDYNQDMTKIDTGIKSAADSATAADGKADANTTSIGDISYLSTTNKNNLVAAVNEVDSNSRTAQKTANAASTTATQAKTEADRLTAFLTLSDSTTVTASATAGTVSAASYLTVMRNNTKSLAKIYGSINITNTANISGTLTVTTTDTGLRPAEDITFNGCAYVRIEDNASHIFRQLPQSYTLKTDGTITFYRNMTSNDYSLNFTFDACLLFITNFGDVYQDGE